MASDWIKMRTDLYRDPKVCAIADALMHQHGELAAYVNQNCQRDMAITRNVMRNVTVGALVSVWGVMRQRGKRNGDDLVYASGALWVVDDVAELPGFGAAMASVGWVLVEEDGLVFPNFFSEYNVDPNEDANAKNAERQRRYREKSKQKSNVTVDVTNASQSNAREEKNREELIPSLSPAKLPTCPTKELIELYHATLPELPECRIETKDRSRLLKDFWVFVLTSKRSDGSFRATDKPSAMEWIGEYFARARVNDFLMGRISQVGKHADWRCNLDFLLSEKGRVQVIEKTKEAA